MRSVVYLDLPLWWYACQNDLEPNVPGPMGLPLHNAAEEFSKVFAPECNLVSSHVSFWSGMASLTHDHFWSVTESQPETTPLWNWQQRVGSFFPTVDFMSENKAMTDHSPLANSKLCDCHPLILIVFWIKHDLCYHGQFFLRQYTLHLPSV